MKPNCSVCSRPPEAGCPTYYTKPTKAQRSKGLFPQAVGFCDACRQEWAAGLDMVTKPMWKAKLAELAGPAAVVWPVEKPKTRKRTDADRLLNPRKAKPAPKKVHGPEAWKARRERRGMSRQELADKVGLSARSIEKWEQGGRQPSKAAALAVEQVLWPTRGHRAARTVAVNPARLEQATLTDRGAYRLPAAG